jgi:hypothetical protein
MREVPFADPDVDEPPAFIDDDRPADAAPDDHALVLPPAGTGIRADRRRRQRRQALRQNTTAVIGAVLVVAIVVALVILRPWQGGGGGDSEQAGPANLPAKLPSSAVLVQQDAQRGAGSITILVVDPSGEGGRVVFVPPATMSEVPSFGLDGVGKALSLGGPSLLQVTLENLIGVGLPPAVIVNDPTMSTMFQPAGALDVNVPTRVEQSDARGAVTVLWDTGQATITPQDAPRFLGVRGQGNDLSRLARHQFFWTAFLDRVARDQAATSALPPDLAKVVKPLALGDVSYEILPVQALDAGSGAGEVYRVRQADLDQLVSQLLPGTTPGGRLRVQVLNGTGVIGASPRVTQRLIPAGGRVVLSGNADSFAYAQTQIVFYDRSRQQAAARIRQALGTGRLVLSRQPLGVVDVTVVVGKDFNG